MKLEGGKKWLIWRPRNGAIVLGVLMLVVVGSRLASTASPAAVPVPVASPAVAVTATAAPAPSWTPEPTTSPTVAPPADIHLSMTGTAEAFITAWARPNLAQVEWLAGIKPWVTPKLASQLITTDPARVPATKVTGQSGLLKYGPEQAWAWVKVPTDAGRMMLTMIPTPSPVCSVCQTWRVDNIVPEGPAK